MAGSAEETVDLARRLDGKFDLLVTDLVMPGRSGVELAEALARSYGAAPVVFVSGDSEDTAAALRAVAAQLAA